MTITRWQDIAPEDAYGLILTDRGDITAPLNEAGSRCPWPWDPTRSGCDQVGKYECPYCGAAVFAGLEHVDYAFVPPGWYDDY